MGKVTDWDPEDPFSICDHLLDQTRQSYFADDFHRFNKHFLLPHVVGSFEGETRINTEEELRETFHKVLEMMHNFGVIDMKRRTIEARFLGPNKIEATSISEYILAGYKVSEEVVAYSILTRIGGQWKIAESRYATKFMPFARAVLRG